ncbi:type II toxin-antitoxin system antitoxin SocA domain-containing protein [Exiguobacterium sp. s130]|uniref:Panacea domain-containing protein n=1 Tax=Exiguobacterium sp. s130 TaxID=2751190 RepID=UPI001BE8C87E|nr:type II toxin-antitoxin system antitoxin SocA domain-containing protein [Exiguobacterium sp. s130]
MREQSSIFDVANFFLSKESMTNKKLQKLSYYAVAWIYTLRGENVAPDTEFQAWRHGPVSPELYDRYKEYGYRSIPSVAEDFSKFSSEELDLLESVWYTYGDQTGNSLEALTHTEDPWKHTFRPDADNRCKEPIPMDLMRNFYSSILIEEDDC